MAKHLRSLYQRASERFCSGKLILICTLDWRPTNNFDLLGGDGHCPPEVLVLSASKLLSVKLLQGARQGFAEFIK